MEKQNFTFTGRLSEIKPVIKGTTKAGKEYASVDFEVTEDDAEYPQVALFSLFKSGEYINNAAKFDTDNQIGDVITVHFNFNKNEYNKKDGSGKGVFYKNSAWKIEKVSSEEPAFTANDKPRNEVDEDDGTTLPF